MLANKLGLKEEDVLKKEVLKERVKARPCRAVEPSMLLCWLPMPRLPRCVMTSYRPVRAAAADARAGRREAGAGGGHRGGGIRG